MTGFVFPNEGIIEWDLLITIYPFITGLVAGAFIVSSLYHVFGISKLKPVARFSLVTALAFLLASPLPLVVHLGRPERALEMFITPNLSSAMSGFGYIWMFYLLLVLVETWLIFRPDIIRYAQSSEGYRKNIYSILALGVHDLSEESLAIDHTLIKVLAFIGIPSAFLLHGYVGFIFGAVKANPWWSTPLMPIIFLLSAIVSGIALLLVMYVVVTKLRKAPLDHDCVRTLGLWLAGFLSLDVVLEGLEVFTMLYESEESWGIIRQLITEKLSFSYLTLQFLIGSVVPLFVLGALAVVQMDKQVRAAAAFLSSILVIIGVFAMRWNVVIGGQLLSKSLRGFTEYNPPLLGPGGILVASILLLLPFVFFAVIAYFVPPWHEEETRPPGKKRVAFGRATIR